MCGACAKPRNITQADLIDGAEIIGAATAVEALVNGAVVEGTSTPRMGFNGDADVLLEEALGKAAFKAREFMDRFRLPEGTVLNTTVVGLTAVIVFTMLMRFFSCVTVLGSSDRRSEAHHPSSSDHTCSSWRGVRFPVSISCSTTIIRY